MNIKLARLFEIVQILLTEKKVTAEKLARHFEVSKRTIYRDIETLTLAQIPIYSEKGRYGGIGLIKNFTIDKSFLSQNEQNEILFALQSLNAIQDSKNNITLTKLNSIFNRKADDWIEVDFSRYGENDSILFEKIKNSILEKKVIEFIYFNTKGKNSKRTVEPLKLWFKEKAWYLFAYCHKKKDIRQFKIARIKNLELTCEHFERELKKEDLKNQNNMNGKGTKIVIEIDKSQAYRVYDEFFEESITKKENENFEITTEIFENEWLYGYLLSFGEHLKVLKPARIREILAKKVEKMRENYKI
ncbi:helix-turn-helix transcriptional regulator [Leptotrichia sp. oral taxon 847]|uniref:helix-turn-helix transcriptional regulator n=1 Tax=Leptotrichia sp. oral taxon 847 TaxID=1785996 RepID=UPI000AACCC5D|nr:YafY family protein [Leptotrichia sp. oral taxon 847]